MVIAPPSSYDIKKNVNKGHGHPRHDIMNGELPSGYVTVRHGKSPCLRNGKPSINGPFSMAMLNNQRV